MERCRSILKVIEAWLEKKRFIKENVRKRKERRKKPVILEINDRERTKRYIERGKDV